MTPLTLGSAGHVDHGKTALVAALTGVDTARLPEEKARGLTIALGYAALALPSGRRLSLIDVPGHERFVRTMVAGASGIDLFLMAVAADDGVMPQTIEHAEVLRALGISHGVVAITKTDLADPGPAAEQAEQLLPGCPIVPCCARTGVGLGELTGALDTLAAALPSRAAAPGPARLHVDRVFTITGRGTVVTGTLWSGTIELGQELELLPSRMAVRVRGLEVHDLAVERAGAGQRVAVNLIGTKTREVARGDVLSARGAPPPTTVLDCALALRDVRPNERVHVHHGTRAAPGRLSALGEDLWQVRLEQPLMALAGDRVVVRRLAPPDTLGGGVVLDAHALRHGRRPDIIERLRRLRAGEPEKPAAASEEPTGEQCAGKAETAASDRGEAQPRAAAAVAAAGSGGGGERELRELEGRLREVGAALLSETQLGEQGDALRALRAQGRAVRVSGRLYAHAEVLAEISQRISALIEHEGPVTLAGVRDALGISRKSAQAFLEHLDAARVTRRLEDDRRVLARGGVRTVEGIR